MRTFVTDQDIQALIDGQLNDDDAELVMLYISDKISGEVKLSIIEKNK